MSAENLQRLDLSPEVVRGLVAEAMGGDAAVELLDGLGERIDLYGNHEVDGRVWYCPYLHDGRMRVVCVQDFDMPDYYEDHFVVEGGRPLAFMHEAHAQLWLALRFPPGNIDRDDQVPEELQDALRRAGLAGRPRRALTPGELIKT